MKGSNIIVCVSLLFALSSCNNEPEEVVTVSAEASPSNIPEIVNDYASSFLCIETNLNTKNYKICLCNKSSIDSSTSSNLVILSPDIICRVYTKINNEWKKENDYPLFKEDGSIATFSKDFEIAKIDGKDYLYFIYSIASMGNGSGGYEELKFGLFSLDDHKLITLNFEGLPVDNEKGKSLGLKGEFNNIKEFANRTEHLSFLYSKAYKSNLIFQPTEKDLDMCLAENYEERWLMDNSNIEADWSTKNTQGRPIRITYYDENIFPGKDQGSFSEIENEHYKIISLFRNNVLGYDKIQRKYFPVWIESCAHGCDKTISFTKESVLKIVYSETDDQSIIVDLEKMTYKFFSK